MKVRKILGSIENFKQTHCIAKLENGKYVVGHFTVGSHAGGAYLYDELEAAVDYWWETLQTREQESA